MMFTIMFLLQGVAQLPHAPSAAPVPTDWAALAPLPYAHPPEMAAALSGFVAGEIAAGRCPISRPVDGHYTVTLDVATFVDTAGIVRRTVPRAIQCPTVEQYGAGLVISFARANLRAGSARDQWYRATIVFDWQG